MKFFLSHSLEPLSFLIYSGAFFWYARISAGTRYWVITYYYLLGSIILLLASLRYEGYTSNNVFYNLLYPITSIAFSWYFFLILQMRWEKFTALSSCIITLVYFFLNLNEVYFDSLGYVITSTGIVLLIFIYLRQLMAKISEEPLSHNFDFWYICIQLMYQLGSFAIFLSYNHFTYQFLNAGDDKKAIGRLLTYLWIVHNIILFVGAIVTVYAVVRVSKKFISK